MSCGRDDGNVGRRFGQGLGVQRDGLDGGEVAEQDLFVIVFLRGAVLCRRDCRDQAHEQDPGAETYRHFPFQTPQKPAAIYALSTAGTKNLTVPTRGQGLGVRGWGRAEQWRSSSTGQAGAEIPGLHLVRDEILSVA